MASQVRCCLCERRIGATAGEEDRTVIAGPCQVCIARLRHEEQLSILTIAYEGDRIAARRAAWSQA